MRQFLTFLFALAVAALLCASSARADYVVKDGNGNLQTIKAGVISGGILPTYTPVDQSGNPFGVSANPIFVAPGSGQTFPISGSITCSNCSGSGVSATFGGAIGTVGTPGGFKDGSGNFQPLLGDVTNGLWVNLKASVPLTVQQPTGTSLHMTCDSGCSSSSSPSFGGSFPTTGTPIGMSQGGLLTALTGTGGALNINISSGNITGFSTSALQTSILNAMSVNGLTTAHTCSVAGFSLASCVGQMDDDIKGPIAAQSNHTTNIGAVDSISQYPAGATPITASATGTTGATTATLAATTGKTTFICGYSIRANATGATTVTNTITGVITATLSSIMWVAPVASGIGVDEQIFSPCVPASTTNTAIAIVSGAPGAGGNVSAKGWGYQL